MHKPRPSTVKQAASSCRLFLCGDVMTGRGIDQILPNPLPPVIYESYMKSALGYVDLAEMVSGHIPRAADWGWIWGEALPVLSQAGIWTRIINLETAITHSSTPWPNKAVNYRMSPDNIECLKYAGISACSLANNHVLDWGYPGLDETLETLTNAGIAHAGAGRNLEEARQPASLDIAGSGQRLLLFAFGMGSSGVSRAWAARTDQPGVNYLPDLQESSVKSVCEDIARFRSPGDRVIVSIHWGPNWGFSVDPAMRYFARRLIDKGAADIVHGHSSHHIKTLEIYRGKLILYGCGDFLNDYEGIRDYEAFRADLTLMYLPSLDLATGTLSALELIPLRIRRFSLAKASARDTEWIQQVVGEGDEYDNTGTRFDHLPDGRLQWNVDDV